MPKSIIRYRNVGIKGPGDLALRRVTWPLDLGVGRLWFTKNPRGVHLAVKRWLIAGSLRVHSFYMPGKKPAGEVPAVGSSAGTMHWYYATAMKGLSQQINHGGTAFTVGRVNR